VSADADRRNAARFAVTVVILGVVVGCLAGHRVILEPGVVGLFHDWFVPPSAGQIVAYAGQLFEGWFTRGLGAPLDYPTEYPYWFALALAARLGVGGAALSKFIVVAAPALAFVCATTLARVLRVSVGGAVLCGFVYSLCPVMLNKLVSGEVTYLFGYAFLPLAVAVCVRTFGSRRWFSGGVVVGALLAIVFVQIQLGVVAAFAVAVAAAACGRPGAAARVATLSVAAATFVVIELPTIAAIVLNHATTGAARAVPAVDSLEWLKFNSVAPLDAIRLIGYVTKYDRIALGGWYAAWSVAAYAAAGCAVLGLARAPAFVRRLAAVVGLAAFVTITGVHSPLAPAVIWLFVHVPLVQVFRELYHLAAALALLFAVGIGFAFDSHVAAARRPLRLALGVLAVAFVAPMLSGDCAGQLVAHPYETELTSVYARLASSDRRIAWFPIDQPLAFLGSGAGVDPMAVTKPGSLWTYSLGWPLTAVDMYARASRWSSAVRGMEMLSVGHVVDRRDFSSVLGTFEKGGVARHYYLDRPLDMPALAPHPVHVFPFDTVYSIGGTPMLYAADAAAIVPRRLGVIGALAGSGRVPFAFGFTPASLPYIVVRDPGDTVDEALAGSAALPLPVSSDYGDAGFARLSSWWYLRPEFSDADSGAIAFGRRRLEVPVLRAIGDGAIEIAWIATPIGGRARIRVGGKTFTIDTQSNPAAWRSVAVRVGALASGSTIEIETVDPGAAVAIRAVRAVERYALRAALSAYASLLARARGVVDWKTDGAGTYRAVGAGSGSQVGVASFGNDYRIDVDYQTDADDYVSVYDPKENLIGFALLPAGRRRAAVAFDGVDATLHLETVRARIAHWTMESRAQGSPTSAYVQIAALQSVAPASGSFDGSRGSIARPRRVAVLNVSFGRNWTASDSAAMHVETVLGTNAWIVPENADRALTVVNDQSRIFHAAFLIGTTALVLALFAPLVVRRRPRRNPV
jgi:hypothetical protein